MIGEGPYYERVREDSVVVGVASAVVCQAVAKGTLFVRVYRNTDENATGGEISLSFGGQAMCGRGLVIGAGEEKVDSSSEQYRCYSGQVSAVSTVADTTLAIFER